MHAACDGLVDKSVHISELRAAFRKTSLRHDDALMPEMSDRAIDRFHAAADLLRQLVDKSVHISELRAAFRKTSLRHDDALMPEMSDRAIDRFHAAADLLRQLGLRACAVGMLLQKIHDMPLRGRQMNILTCNHIPLLLIEQRARPRRTHAGYPEEDATRRATAIIGEGFASPPALLRLNDVDVILIEQRARPRRTHAGYPEEDATRRATAIIGEGFASPPALLRLNDVDVIFGIVSCSEQQHPAADGAEQDHSAENPAQRDPYSSRDRSSFRYSGKRGTAKATLPRPAVSTMPASIRRLRYFCA